LRAVRAITRRRSGIDSRQEWAPKIKKGARVNTDLSAFLPTFLFGFSSLFPLINPIGTAFIIQPYFSTLDDAARRRYVIRIVLICFVMGLMALHLGSYVLKLMGVSIAATQTAGGIVIAILGFNLLNSAQTASQDVVAGNKIDDSIFYPLSFPLTLGPGGISTLIALSAHVHSKRDNWFSAEIMAVTLSLLVVLTIAYFCFFHASKVVRSLGPNGSQVLNRLMSFLVFCIGIQMTFAGIMGLIKSST
jgi:multiple antibiotic resistance protein